jgi:hypothetical protein
MGAEALSRAVDGIWTVAALLAHLAYWEGRQVGVIEAWQRHGITPAWWTRNEADAVNGERLPLWLEVPPQQALEEALTAAEALDRVMAALPRDAIDALPARRRNPAAHRGEHLDAIERALASGRE